MKKDDLGLRIGTKDEVVWTQVLKTAEAGLISLENELLVQKGMIELAKSKIKAEKQKV